MGRVSGPEHTGRNAVNKDLALRATIKIFIVDDHPGFRGALRGALNLSGRFRVIGEAESGRDCIDQVRQGLDVDVILMDISMPGMSGVDATQEVMRICPGAKVIVMTMHDRTHYEEAAIAAGARSIVAKGVSISDLETVIERVVQGELGVRISGG